MVMTVYVIISTAITIAVTTTYLHYNFRVKTIATLADNLDSFGAPGTPGEAPGDP